MIVVKGKGYDMTTLRTTENKDGINDSPEITDAVSAIMNTVYFISEDNEKERTEFQNFDCGCSDSKAGKCLKPCAWTERISLEDSI